MVVNSAAKKGCALWLTASHDNAPPCSRRRSKCCTAGVSKTAGNKPPAVFSDRFCIKRRQRRSVDSMRQVRRLTQKQCASRVVFINCACVCLPKLFCPVDPYASRPRFLLGLPQLCRTCCNSCDAAKRCWKTKHEPVVAGV